MRAQATDGAMPPSPFTDGTGFCSVCLYRTPLWVAAEGAEPAAWLCEDHDEDRPRRGDGSLGRRPLPEPRPRQTYVADLPPGHYAVDDDAFRARMVARVRAKSRDLAWRPEEWVGREGHTALLGGPFVDVAHDDQAPEQLRQWARSAMALMRDLPRRRELQETYLSPAELEAVDHYWSGEL